MATTRDMGSNPTALFTIPKTVQTNLVLETHSHPLRRSGFPVALKAGLAVGLSPSLTT